LPPAERADVCRREGNELYKDAQATSKMRKTAMAAGEELTDSYINLLQSRADRQAELSEQKGFECSCRRCAAALLAFGARSSAGRICSAWSHVRLRKLQLEFFGSPE